jgi:hypothetical protein
MATSLPSHDPVTAENMSSALGLHHYILPHFTSGYQYTAGGNAPALFDWLSEYGDYLFNLLERGDQRTMHARAHARKVSYLPCGCVACRFYWYCRCVDIWNAPLW